MLKLNSWTFLLVNIFYYSIRNDITSYNFLKEKEDGENLWHVKTFITAIFRI